MPTDATPPIEEMDDHPGKRRPVSGLTLRVERWTAERRIFRESAAKPITLALRLVDYPAWSVRIDGSPAHLDSTPETGEILLRLPAGSHQIEIDFRRTWDRTAGAILSVLSAAGLAGFAAMDRRRKSLETSGGLP